MAGENGNSEPKTEASLKFTEVLQYELAAQVEPLSTDIDDLLIRPVLKNQLRSLQAALEAAGKVKSWSGLTQPDESEWAAIKNFVGGIVSGKEDKGSTGSQGNLWKVVNKGGNTLESWFVSCTKINAIRVEIVAAATKSAYVALTFVRTPIARQEKESEALVQKVAELTNAAIDEGLKYDVDAEAFLELAKKVEKLSNAVQLETIKEEQVLELALKKNLVGLSFSGGGIRSATFNLGVLQGLADCTRLTAKGEEKPDGLLDKIHYLSSVSGGGYISSWLAGWVLRDGDLKNVEQQLRPNRIDQARAERDQDPKQSVDPEPPPFHHLREFSNYLTPKTGVFSTDSWTLYSLYLRNLIAIQSILIPLLATAIFFVLYVAWFYVNRLTVLPSLSKQSADHPLLWWSMCGIVPLFIASGIAAGRLSQLRRTGLPVRQGYTLRLVLWCLRKSSITSRNIEISSRLIQCGLVTFLATLATTNCNLPMPLAICLWLVVFFFAISALAARTTDDDDTERYSDRWLQKWFAAESQGSVFLTLLLFILAAAALSGALISLIEYRVPRVGGDPLSFLSPNKDNCCPLSWPQAWWKCVQAKLPALGGTFPNGLVGCWLLTMAICTLGRLLLNVSSICSFLPHLLWDRKVPKALNDLRWILSGIISGVTSGSLLFLFEYAFIFNTLGILHAIRIAVLAPPAFLLIFSLGEVMALAILSGLESARIREWFAAMGGKILMAATAWVVISGLVLSAPNIVIFLNDYLNAHYGALLGGVFWLGSSLLSAWTASRSKSDGSRLSILDLIIKAGPPVFLIGLLIAASAAASQMLQYSLAGSTASPMVYGDILKGNNIANELALTGGVALAIAFFLGRFININLFSLQELYQNRLVRCYLGASRLTEGDGRDKNERPQAPFVIPKDLDGGRRTPEFVTGFDENDDFHLGYLDRQTHCIPRNVHRKKEGTTRYSGPFHIFCTALNLIHGKELAWQERMAESFVFTPLHAGSIGTGFRRIGRPDDEEVQRLAQYGSGMNLGQVVALSGAAVSPNMGYYTTSPVTALLTIFNLRLGAWLGNPRTSPEWMRPGPKLGWLHLLKEVLGFTNAEENYVYISDGGHFDNLGAYELIRRRCRIVICCDAGADPKGTMHELGMLVRKVRTDFGIRIEINTDALKADEKGFCRSHAAVGVIKYSDRHGIPHGLTEKDVDGYFIYVKPSFTGDEPSDVIDYRTSYPDFPHQTTIDQFFSESQFESYRALGYHAIRSIFLDSVQKVSSKSASLPPNPHPDMLAIIQDVMRRLELSMSKETVDRYVSLNDNYARLQKELGTRPSLARLSREIQWLGVYLPLVLRKEVQEDLSINEQELYDQLKNEKDDRQEAAYNSASILAERQFLIQMITLLENAYFALNMVNYRWNTEFGWLQVLRIWRHCSIFDSHWPSFKQEFSKEFREFIDKFHLFKL